MTGEKVSKIWILNHYASGNEDRHDNLANHLAKHGIEVIVIASSYNHSEHSYKTIERCSIESRNDARLRYIWLRTSPKYKKNGIKRIFNMISYMLMVKLYSKNWWKKYGKPDAIIGSSVHPFTWEAAYWISKKTGAEFYAEVRDLWPLSLVELQGFNPKHPLVILFGILEKRAYHRAKKIITSMPYAYRYITNTLGISRYKIEWIPNGIDTEKIDNMLKSTDISLPKDLNAYLEENWCAVYTGSIVESECIDYILAVAKILQNKGNNMIKFAIVGDGHLKNKIINEAKENDLQNVTFFNKVTKKQVALTVSKAKVCLAVVRNLPIYKYGLSMNKLNDYLYSGNPTIFVCDYENVVKTSGGGISIPYGDIELFAETIEKVYYMSKHEKENMGEKGRYIIKKQYDMSVLAKGLLTQLDSNYLDINKSEKGRYKTMEKQVCTRCVMDNVADDTIVFEPNGTCNYCNYALSRKDTVYYPTSEGKQKLGSMINLLKEEGKGKEFDCLMGLSGGLDSTYLAYFGAKEWGLRILAVHIDDGFDTEIAKQNIKKLCNKFNIKLIVEKPDNEQYMDLIKSFLRAEVPGIAIPQDNVLLASLKNYAKKYDLKYYLSGANFSLESILQRGNSHVASDGAHVKAIHKIYGDVPLNNIPLTTLFERYFSQKYISRINTLYPLDLIDYNRDRAIQELQKNADFDYYGGKHYESIFTKFVQVYYLPKKFNVDKRKSHFSSLIVSGQMTREEALEELKKPLFDEIEMENDINNILNMIDMNREEFDKLMQEPGKSHREYKVSVLTNFSGMARKYRKFLGV